MRRLTIVVSTLGLLLSRSAALHAQAGFEGVIEFKTAYDEEDGERTMVQMSKGSKIRFEQHGSESSDEAGIAIFDLTSRNMVVLLPSQHTYMTMDLRAQGKAAKKPVQANGRDAVKFTRTGRTETVAGVSCDIYHATGTEDGEPMEGDACLAKGIGFAMFEVAAALKGDDQSQDPVMGMFEEFVRQDLHVIKMTEIKEGKARVTLVAVKIERKSLDPALFSPPAGFTEMKMPAAEH
jgi:hypothetical protein